MRELRVGMVVDFFVPDWKQLGEASAQVNQVEAALTGARQLSLSNPAEVFKLNADLTKAREGLAALQLKPPLMLLPAIVTRLDFNPDSTKVDFDPAHEHGCQVSLTFFSAEKPPVPLRSIPHRSYWKKASHALDGCWDFQTPGAGS